MRTKADTNVTCKKCGWVAFQVSREYAEDQVKRFNEYFESLTKKEQKELYGGKGASLSFYERCIGCGGSYKNFRTFKKDDCPDGCTLNPVISRNE